MRGRKRAHDRADERAYFQAWATEHFARKKKLKPFGKYLSDLQPKKPQAAAEVLAIFRGFEAAGVPVNIRKVS